MTATTTMDSGSTKIAEQISVDPKRILSRM